MAAVVGGAGGGGTRVGLPHDVKVPVPVTCKAGELVGCGKTWLKVKPVNVMPALLVMVNVRVASTLTLLLLPGGLMIASLGSNSMVKVGAGSVTVRLIAAAVALGAWLLLRVTAGLVRDPGRVTRRSRLMVQLALAANEPLINEMESDVSVGEIVRAPPQPLLKVATNKPAGKASEKLRPVRSRSELLVIV
jgi:hypothetical protein